MKLPTALLLCLLFIVPIVSQGAAQTAVTCDQFTSQAAAQIVLNDQNAPQLDPDGDGTACNARLPIVLLPPETLQGEPGAQASPGPAPSTPVSISFTLLTPTPTGDTEATPASSSTGDQLTMQEEQYFAALLQDLIALDDASKQVAELFIDAGQDASLLEDPEWRQRTDEQFDRLARVGVDAESLEPSTRQRAIHDLWLEVNRLVTLAVADFREGLGNRDAARITTGSARYTYSSLLADDLGNAIKAFGEDPDQPPELDHVVAPVTECDVFSDYDEAQLYYAANPEEQETIDPDFDGLACEVFFEQE